MRPEGASRIPPRRDWSSRAGRSACDKPATFEPRNGVAQNPTAPRVTRSEPSRSDEITAATFFVFRTPLLPISEWTGWSDGLSAPSAVGRGSDEAALADAVAADKTLLLNRLRIAIARPELRQALFLAAPGVDRELERLGSTGEPDGKLRRTLVRYFARMTGRATPFGSFAGCSLGRTGGASRLCTVSMAQWRTFTTLDIGFLHGVTNRLRQAETTHPCLRVRTNPTIYRVGDRLRYVEIRSDPETMLRSYHLSAVVSTSAIDAVLDRAAQSATLAELGETVRNLGQGVTDDVARSFINDLLNSQLLTGGIEPSVTGPEPLAGLLTRLDGVRTPAASRVREVLGETERAVRSLDGDGLGHPPARYQDLLPALRTIYPDFDPGRCFQVNLYKPAPEAILSGTVTAAIADAVRLLHQVTPYSGLKPLNLFQDSFAGKYGAREVPLLEALDEDIGVGYDADPTRDATDSPWLPDTAAVIPVTLGGTTWTRRDEHLLKRLVGTLAAGEQVLALDDSDVEELADGRHPPLPPYLSASVSLAAPSEEDADPEQLPFLIQGIVGPSGAEFLGRFCHGDPGLNAAVGDWLNQQEAAETGPIPAEIVHLPQPRDGNLVCRPRFRKHEILCLGEASPATDDVCQIPVSDLTIRLVGNQLVLRSRALGRDIAPRLAASHYAPTADLTLYRFLWALQRQDAAALTWQWGALAGSPFLPRVTAGRAVLCRAMWRLDTHDLASLQAVTQQRDKTLSQVFKTVAQLRNKRGIPRHVSLLERDKALPLDLDNVLCAEVLAAEAAGSDSITLIEQYPCADRLYATSPEGRFVHELLLPFRNDANRGSAPLPRPATVGRPRVATWRFSPGGEWLYAKIYASPRNLDRILVEAVAPAIRALKQTNLAKHWFFIRYWDPQPHLRVRLHGPPQRMRSEAWRNLEQALRPYLDRGDIRTVQLDTYERETERYGGPEAIQAAEQFFTADSDLAVSLLELDPGRAADKREQLAVASISFMLNDFGFAMSDRVAWSRTVRDALVADLGLGRDAMIGFGHGFRHAKGSLERLIDVVDDGTRADAGQAWHEPVREALHRRSPETVAFAATLRRLERAGRLTASVPGIIASLAHMSVNRLVPRSPRHVEAAILDVLHRLCAGAAARSEKEHTRRRPDPPRAPSQ
jgi:lantibiotic biosynthesis protein